MTRPGAEVGDARADAAWCVEQLRRRRWKITVIAGRLGVSPQTVHRWKCATSAPRTEARMARLVGLTRAVMQLPAPVTRLVGMHAVIETVRVALGVSGRELSRRLALSECVVGNWRALGTLPGRRATLRLRALLIELQPEDAAALINICDARIKLLGNETQRRNERFRRLREVHLNREAVRGLRRRGTPSGPLTDP